MNSHKNCMLFDVPVPRSNPDSAGADKADAFKEAACVVSGYMVLAAMLLFALSHC